MEAKACVNCARSRRRCGKQKPDCLRCTTRRLRCHYPPSKPSCFVPLIEEDAQRGSDCSDPSLEVLVPALLVPNIAGYQLESGWFASPETWTIDKAPAAVTANIGRFSSVDLDRLLKRVIGWLVNWVEDGSNPFIHRQLYRHRLPQCIQDAYLSLATYLQKTDANEQIIFRILEDRITQLVAQGVASLSSTRGNGSDSARRLDTLEHLAKAQSLLVYQCICLFDGNIRLRHLAEQHVPVLEDWLSRLIDQAGQTTYGGESLVFSPSEWLSAPMFVPQENLLWYSWILAESTRRTWLVAAGVQGIYKLIRDGTASCMGGTIFTSRRGFWEAPSAVVWEKRCSEVYAGLVRLTEVDKMFATVPKEEINDFAKVVLECTFGVEQVERWGV